VAGGRGFSVLLNDVVEHVTGEIVGAGYFTIFCTLATAVVFSHEIWQRHFDPLRTLKGE